MDLVDKENDILIGADLIHDALEALLKVSAVARARDESREVERKDRLPAQKLRNLSRDDRLCKALDDGTLAHTRFADEHGIVFCAPRQNLNDLLDFLAPSDDGIDLPLARLLREIGTIGE